MLCYNLWLKSKISKSKIFYVSVGYGIIKKKLDFNENFNDEEECFLSVLNVYFRYIYEKL